MTATNQTPDITGARCTITTEHKPHTITGSFRGGCPGIDTDRPATNQTPDPRRLHARACCATTEGDVHSRQCPGPAPLTDATSLNLINRIEDPSGASVGMWAGVYAAPIEWGGQLQYHPSHGRKTSAIVGV